MRGTEKQMAFAESLINRWNAETDKIMSICPDEFLPRWKEVKNICNETFAEAYAGDVIELLKGVKGEEQAYYKSFYTGLFITSSPLAKAIREKAFPDGPRAK